MFYRMVEVVSSGALTRVWRGKKSWPNSRKIFALEGQWNRFLCSNRWCTGGFGWFSDGFGWFSDGLPFLFNKTSAVWLMISTVQVGQAIFGLRSYMFMIINIQTYYCIYIYMNMICILYIIMYIYVYIIYSVTCMQYDCMYCIVYIVLVASILRGQDLQSQLWQSLSDWWGGIPWWVWFNATLNKWKGWMSCRFSL